LPFGSYEAAFKFSQEFYLIVEFQSDIHEEVYLPLFALNIPFGIGSVRGGLYLVIGIDGSFRLEIEVREWTKTKLGVGGATFLCLPASIRPVFSLEDVGVYGNVEMNGKLNAYAKLGPMIDITICGINLVGAGAFLGVGADVNSDGSNLDIKLYGIIEVYVKVFGKTFNIIHERPSILRKKQKDTGGYLVNIADCFISPGRIGGTIKQEPPAHLEPYVPSAGRPYRIKVARGTQILYYPSTAATDNGSGSSWPKTNKWGEFFEGDGKSGYDADKGIADLTKDDKVSVEFYGANGTKYESAATSPSPSFNSITILEADYFNDYVIGQVDPIRLRNWQKDPQDEANNTVLRYYSGEVVTVQQVLDYFQYDYSGLYTSHYDQVAATAQAVTDGNGRFDTRRDFGGNPGFNVSQIGSSSTVGNAGTSVTGYFKVTFNYGGITVSPKKAFKPSMAPFIYSREVKPVEGSHKKETLPDGRILDSTQYDEYIYITNPHGTRAPAASEIAFYINCVYTYADEYFYTYGEAMEEHYGGSYESRYAITTPKPEDYYLVTTVKDGIGVTMMSRRVTVEWVWQNHPNPVVITSDKQTTLDTNGGAFQVTAGGICPAYSVSGAPSGVTINRDTGRLSVSAGVLEPGKYTFTISAVQDVRQIGSVSLALPAGVTLQEYYGNDPMPPDTQAFTLTIVAAAPPDQQAEAPVVAFDNQGYSIEAGASFQTTYNLTGTDPVSVTVSVEDAVGAAVTGFTHSAESRTISTPKNFNAGIYIVTVTAANFAGTYTAAFTLAIMSGAPVFVEGSYDGYIFGRSEAFGTQYHQIYVDSAAPVAFSIIPTESNQTAFPDVVFIDPVAGELAIGADIAPGLYYFTIRATNCFGSAEQDCTLWVGAEHKPAVVAAASGVSIVPASAGIAPPAAFAAGGVSAAGNVTYTVADKSLKARAGAHLTVIEEISKLDRLLAVSPGYTLNPDAAFNQPGTPLNNVTIRWDDTRDVYTYDRDTVNGAEFIVWSTRTEVNVLLNEPIIKLHILQNYYKSAFSANDYFGEIPDFFNDAYHAYLAPYVPDYAGQIIGDVIKEQTGTIYIPGGSLFGPGSHGLLGDMFGKNVLQDYLQDMAGNPVVNPVQYLDFGSVLNDMNGVKGGLFEVGLDENTGSMITGKLFDGLAGSKGSDLVITQDGATITFNQKNLTKGASEDAMYNVGYTAGSTLANQMLAAAGAAGASGGQSFSYSFGGHGDLPGTATFDIQTGISEGSSVNVYKYDSGTGSFSQVAGNVKVGAGGVVSYKNNTLSDYFITTDTIEGAAKSPMLRINDPTDHTILTVTLIIIAVLLAAGITVFVVLSKRRQAARTKKGEL
ncbi:MAG: hypothetical protein FWE62_03435, partial [Firmicutes bacterium]|nr:hypothetical protein [Bacillota bacterium]